MTVYLVRHAHAGERSRNPHDIYRPLSDRGRERSRELVGELSDKPITAIWSSPATRCVQTVEPLAQALGLDIVEDETFWETASPTEAFTPIDSFVSDRTGDLVVCSHGDLIPEMIAHLVLARVPIMGQGCEKGSIWALMHNGEQWVEARYLDRGPISS